MGLLEKTALENDLECVSTVLERLRREVLWSHWIPGQYNESRNPDEPITLTWGQLDRWFNVQQALLANLALHEARRRYNAVQLVVHELGV